MSENVELARKAFQAFGRRDISQIEDLCHPDIEMDWSRRLIDPVVTRGHDGLRQFFEEALSIFEKASFEEEEILEFDDKVLVVSMGHFKGRVSGIDVQARAAIVWTVRGGKLASFCFYQSKEDALEDLKRQGAQVSADPSTPAA
jgi:ketosteroid isomerase-like protein